MVEWNAVNWTLTFTVADGMIIPNDVDTVVKPIDVHACYSSRIKVVIPGVTGLKLPSKLSEGDGLITIEALGCYIKREPVKGVPAVGPPKLVLSRATKLLCRAGGVDT